MAKSDWKFSIIIIEKQSCFDMNSEIKMSEVGAWNAGQFLLINNCRIQLNFCENNCYAYVVEVFVKMFLICRERRAKM